MDNSGRNRGKSENLHSSNVEQHNSFRQIKISAGVSTSQVRLERSLSISTFIRGVDVAMGLRLNLVSLLVFRSIFGTRRWRHYPFFFTPIPVEPYHLYSILLLPYNNSRVILLHPVQQAVLILLLAGSKTNSPHLSHFPTPFRTSKLVEVYTSGPDPNFSYLTAFVAHPSLFLKHSLGRRRRTERQPNTRVEKALERPDERGKEREVEEGCIGC